MNEETGLDDFDVGLFCRDDTPEEVIELIRNAFNDESLTVAEKQFPNQPSMAMEWLIPTAIGVYLAKPFVDEIRKRAAKDFGDKVYPALKSRLSKVFSDILRDVQVTIFTQGGHKTLDSPGPTLLSVTTDSKDGRSLKFVFLESLPEDEMSKCLELMLLAIKDHYQTENDDISMAASKVKFGDKNSTICLVYKSREKQWQVKDPFEEPGYKTTIKIDDQ